MITIYILHAGLSHPSPYFYNFCKELDKEKGFNYIINPELPETEPNGNGIIYFNRLKRFYDSDNMETADIFLKKINNLKNKGWKIVWTVHNFFPIDRRVSEVDEFVVKEFIKKCDLVFTLTDFMKKSIMKNYHVAAINHGMGFNELDGVFDKKVIKCHNYKDFTFTFVGNIYKYKMLDKVIESFNKLSNAKLIIAGKEPKNSNVNIKDKIKGNKNIIYIDEFIGKSDWETLSKMTDSFINIYDLNTPAFKYGFFPSNFINIYYYGNICISPSHEIIKELIPSSQIVFYDFKEEDGLFKAMNFVKQNGKKKKIKNEEAKEIYNWDKTIKIFVSNCKKLFQ